MKKLAIFLVAMLVAAPMVFGATLYEGFNDGSFLSEWTVLNGNDGHNWEFLPYPGVAHTGDGLVGVTFTSSSDFGNDYLITPQLALVDGDHMGFWAKSYVLPGDEFDVRLSTTGTNRSDFDVTLFSGMVHLAYQLFTYDLSAYAGQDCYLAIVMTNCEYYLCVDDFEVGNYDPVATKEASWSGVKALFR